jgi:hypothetical protein
MLAVRNSRASSRACAPALIDAFSLFRRWPRCSRSRSRADHALNLRLITRLLQLQDFDVTAVADGGAALDALRANYDAHPPAADRGDDAMAAPIMVAPFDLAILDTNMPARTHPACA